MIHYVLKHNKPTLPFWNVLNRGIVAAFAVIDEIPKIAAMRIDRKKIFLALSDFPIDTPPRILFPNMPA